MTSFGLMETPERVGRTQKFRSVANAMTEWATYNVHYTDIQDQFSENAPAETTQTQDSGPQHGADSVVE